MTKHAPPLPANIAPLVDEAIASSRRKLESGHEVTGVAYVDAPGVIGNPDPKMRTLIEIDGLVAVPMRMFANSKDAWRKVVQLISREMEARFVMVVSEAWAHEPDSQAHADALLRQYKEVRHIPGAKELMMVQVETHAGFWQARAEIVPFAARPGARTFGAMSFDDKYEHHKGRMVGLLMKKGSVFQ